MVKSNKLDSIKYQHKGLFIFTCDDNYIPYLSVAIRSMVQHASVNNFYEIAIIGFSLTKESESVLLNEINKNSNFKIRFIYAKKELSKVNYAISYKSVYTNEMYLKIFVPFLLPYYQKGVILDCDVLFNTDPIFLYNTNLNNNIIAGVKDVGFVGYFNNFTHFKKDPFRNKNLNLKHRLNFVNSGVFVCDFVKYRSTVSFNDLTKMCTVKRECQDQEIINIICKDRILFLPYNWNLFNYVNYRYELSINNLPRKEYLAYIKARKKPYLIHYNSIPKPWQVPALDMAEYWWKAAKGSKLYSRFIDDSKNADKWLRRRIPARIRLYERWFPKGTKRRKIFDKVKIKKTSKIYLFYVRFSDFWFRLFNKFE